MDNHTVFQRYLTCSSIFVLYLAVSIPLYLHTRENLYFNMVWNVFLSFLPLLFADLLRHEAKKQRWITSTAFGALWLIFFPNAPYMVTDMIHISGHNFYLGRQEYNQILLSGDMTLWIRIVYIGIGVLTGLLAGLISLQIVDGLLRQKVSSPLRGLILAGIFLLSGYGIYLGRFVRLNSWNLFHPHRFLAKATGSTSLFSLKFTILYAFFVGAVYVVFSVFCPEKSDGKKDGV